MCNKDLKKLLIDREMTMKELAEKANVDYHHLSLIINGRKTGYKIREKIAFALDVPYESIWKPEPPKEK